LFPPANVAYAFKRLGLVPQDNSAANELSKRAIVEPEKNVRIAKLLFARDEVEDERFLCITFRQVRDFFRGRFRAHGNAKFRDRLFFPSELIQNTIDELLAEEGKRKARIRELSDHGGN
jgi:hypothetical protein